MKPVILFATLMLAAFPAVAIADDQEYYCSLDGYGYLAPDGDSYSMCMDNCDGGACSTSPPGSDPGSPGEPAGGTGEPGDGGSGGEWGCLYFVCVDGECRCVYWMQTT